MEHITRRAIAYRNGTRRVLRQCDNIYVISYKRKEVTVTVDPYSGAVYEVEAGINFSIKL